MRNPLALILGLALLLCPSLAVAKEAPKAQPGDTITWMRDVPAAFEKAKKERKVLMICINSKHVDGRSREEPAAKGLREIIYKDVRVVGKSRDFVCVFLTPAAAGEDYGELRHRFGIDGLIVSPQHIFAHPDHTTGKPLLRMEYWSYGQGDPAVKQLLSMMEQALGKYRAMENLPAPTPEADKPDEPQEPAAPAAPDAEDERKKWIQNILSLVSGGSDAKRQEALTALVMADKEGDCLHPLAELLPTLELDAQKIDVIRTLGRDKLRFAAPFVEPFVKDKNEAIRGNAAVTLEYIGCPTSVKALSKRLSKEKVESIHNNLARALGRCGKGDSKVRQTLVKRSAAGKTPLWGLGAIIGLAYFEKDAKAARAVEKLLKKVGPPSFGRRGWRGMGTSTLRRTLLTYTLSEIGDPKSEKFVQEELIKPLRNIQNRWMRPLTEFYGNVIRAIRGEDGAKGDVEGGVTYSLGLVTESQDLKDPARKERDATNFTPKADWDIEPRSFGGGPGGGGRGNGKGNGKGSD